MALRMGRVINWKILEALGWHNETILSAPLRKDDLLDLLIHSWQIMSPRVIHPLWREEHGQPLCIINYPNCIFLLKQLYLPRSQHR